jgi:WD40-like Beta Propeller Repeat
MHDDLAGWLRSGSADLAARLSPASPETVRARGNRRRRRRAIVSGLLAFALGAAGGGTAYASLARPAGGMPAGVYPGPAAAAGGAQAGRPGIVAVTQAGAVVMLDPVTGRASRVLVASGAVGDAVSVSPGGSAVYFTVRKGCADVIESVPVAGGTPRAVTTGVLPAVSPDGSRLAFAREPARGGGTPIDYLKGCRLPDITGTQLEVVVRDLATGQERIYPGSPASPSALPYPVSRLSWAPDGRRLLVSAGPSQDNEGWRLVVMDVAKAKSYLPSPGAAAVPLAGPPDAAGSYYNQGVFLPDGNMFVNRVCCAGWPARKTSSLMWEIDPAGRLVRQVAIGFADRDHGGLDADQTGRWLLYLSGRDLFVSHDGAAPVKLTSGLVAAAWALRAYVRASGRWPARARSTGLGSSAPRTWTATWSAPASRWAATPRAMAAASPCATSASIRASLPPPAKSASVKPSLRRLLR